MFAKGRQPGYGAREQALRMNPKLVCERVTRSHNGHSITGYVIRDASDASGKQFVCALQAGEAWSKALSRLMEKASENTGHTRRRAGRTTRVQR